MTHDYGFISLELFVLNQLTFNNADDDESGWGFHNWALNEYGWNAYRNKYGVPIEMGPVRSQIYIIYSRVPFM